MDFWKLLGFNHLYGEATVGVRNMDRAIDWYCETFDLISGRKGGEEVTLGYPTSDKSGTGIIPLISLVQIPAGMTDAAVEEHPVLFTKHLKRIYDDFVSKGIVDGPIEEDSGGNHFFRFRDLEGNKIEVCLEPGKKLS